MNYLNEFPGIKAVFAPPFLLIYALALVALIIQAVDYSKVLDSIFGRARIKIQEDEIQVLKKNLKKALEDKKIDPECFKAKFERFEDIQEVNIGLLNFQPSLALTNTRWKGPAKAIIDEIFDKKAKYQEGILLNWNNILTNLNNEQYDLLATPVYDTPDRRKQGLLSIPLYYANMGIYIRKDGPIAKALLNDKESSQSKLEFGLLELSKAFGKTKLGITDHPVTDGEVNKFIINKYFASIETTSDSEEFEITRAIAQIADPTRKREFLVCEKWIAENNDKVVPDVKKKDATVINILKDHELLYPVVLMMRAGEEALRKFVNLRLLGIYDDDKFYDLIHSGLKEIYGDKCESKDKLKAYFFRGENSLKFIMTKEDFLREEAMPEEKSNITVLRR